MLFTAGIQQENVIHIYNANIVLLKNCKKDFVVRAGA
jgi:hypothetical protein